MSECCTNHPRLRERLKSDKGFMGVTHALSAVALFLAFTAFFPQYVTDVLGTEDIWVILLSLSVSAGAALIPDLDNTTSTSKNSLGYLGDALSFFFRTTSSVIQTLIRLPRDDSSPNPHRGFYHTVPAALILGGLVFLGTRLESGAIDLPLIGTLNHGGMFALVITWLCIHMALAGLARASMKKMKSKAGVFGEAVAFFFSLGITVLIFFQLPTDLDYWWLGVSVAFGCLAHMLGDCFTTAGCPILFPIPIKGKLWWDIRLMKIKAGGVTENYLFTPFFLIVILVSMIKIVNSI